MLTMSRRYSRESRENEVSLLIGGHEEKDCWDLKALSKRNWPTDKVIKKLMSGHIEILELHPEDWEALCEQMGCKRSDYFYGPYGETLVKEGTFLGEKL